MYPHNFFSLFPPFPRTNSVFVAMSFEERFNKRWEQVIKPAINMVSIRGERLKALRVDERKVSDSILTDILDGIASCSLFFGDITTIGFLNERPMRNSNVMYEIGIAHATRLPEEVLIFRSDNDDLLFDVANIRVNTYNPDNSPDNEMRRVAESIYSSLREIQIQKHYAIQKAADLLDFDSWMTLSEITNRPMESRFVKGFRTKNDSKVTDSIDSIRRLLELGAIKTVYHKLTPLKEINGKPLPSKFKFYNSLSDSDSMVSYEATNFGYALADEAAKRIL